MNSVSPSPAKRSLRRHWADQYAQQLMARRKEGTVLCAAGISPSGRVHIGNFREIITVDLVSRALQHRGRTTRFLLFWDDYDALRKVPSPAMSRYLRRPLAQIPPLHNSAAESYAQENEMEVEQIMPQLGIHPQYIYQYRRYSKAEYAPYICEALNKRAVIRQILNQHRREALAEDWWPVTVFSRTSGTDRTTIVGWDGERRLYYRCHQSGTEEEIDIFHSGRVKLQWRVDWPARWAKENVDFEPAGKDHHSPGGSFDTAREIVQQVYGGTAPISLRYDFIGIKGLRGKMSSSSGATISIQHLLQIYQPQVVRYLFAATRPHVEFFLSFDEDVIKIYEDYDRCERIYFGLESVGEERRAKERRIYELSQIEGAAAAMPPQIPFRHLCNLIQIYDGDIEQTLRSQALYLATAKPEQVTLRGRARCAQQWLQMYAPPQFCFMLAAPVTHIPSELRDKKLRGALQLLYREIDDNFPLKRADAAQQLQNRLYTIAAQQEMEPKLLFIALYKILIGKSEGPRLAHFLSLIGQKRLLVRLEPFLD